MDNSYTIKLFVCLTEFTIDKIQDLIRLELNQL